MGKNNRKLTVNGKVFASIESAAKAFGKSRNTVDYRLSKKWTPEQAVGVEPPPSFASNTPGISVQIKGQKFHTLKAAAKHYNRAYTHVIEMLKKGRSIEHALGLVKSIDTLDTKRPELAKQWHPTKNLPLTPNDVSYGSGKKVWWLCSNNHEWQAVINSRKNVLGCPYCAGQKPTPERNFAIAYPELLKEWDLEKNGKLDPTTLTPRANRKIWWKCKRGHSWQATILNKTRLGYKGECPYCLNRKLTVDNSLAKLRPDISQDWHPTKNGTLTPNDIIAGGSKKVWWVCKHNHEWQATVGARVHSGHGCPNCSLQTSRIEIAVYSEIKALFKNVSWREKIDKYECDILINDKNIGIEIDGIHWHKNRSQVEQNKQKAFEQKGIILFRLREEGLKLLSERDVSFKWSDNTFPIISRLITQICKFAKLEDDERSTLEKYVLENKLINEFFYREIVSQLPAPPYELSLACKFPEISKEWDLDLNAPLSPEHFKPGASKRVYWRCREGHVWKTSLNNRTNQGNNCPHCPRERLVKISEDWNLAANYPHLVSEWHFEKNGSLSPDRIRPKSNSKVWWKCKLGHEWKATPSGRAKGAGCPICSGRIASTTNNLAALFPNILTEWDNESNSDLSPNQLTPFSNKKIWWKCKNNAKHKWQSTVYNRTKLKSGCPLCARSKARKSTIEDIQEFAKQNGGVCLSDDFVSSRKKLKMKCQRGHVFETRADNVIYKQRWSCPHCSMKKQTNSP